MSVQIIHPSTFAYLHALNLRAELRRALLAAAEACWVYALLLTFAKIAGFARVISPFGIALVYWVALTLGYYFPRARRAWHVLQWASLAIIALTMVVAMRV